MHRIIIVILSLITLKIGSAYGQTTYSISYDQNGFYNYKHAEKKVIFYEIEFLKKSGKFSGMNHMIYKIDLNSKEINIYNSIDPKSCFKFYPKMHFNKSVVVTINDREIFFANEKSNDCSAVNYQFKFNNYSWSINENKLIFSDRDNKSFHLYDPASKIFDRRTYDEHSSFFVWSAQINSTLYVYTPKKHLASDDISYTSDDLEYFYIDKNSKWVRYEEKHPLKNPEGDVYFRQYSDIEEPVTTEFYDVKTNKKLSTASDMGLSHSNTNIIWLEGGWVYIQGSYGIFNYRKGEMVHFSSDDKERLVPFSVDQDRYAIMYSQKEDRLNVYDLKELKFIASYKPFWRDNKESETSDKTPAAIKPSVEDSKGEPENKATLETAAATSSINPASGGVDFVMHSVSETSTTVQSASTEAPHKPSTAKVPLKDETSQNKNNGVYFLIFLVSVISIAAVVYIIRRTRQ